MIALGVIAQQHKRPSEHTVTQADELREHAKIENRSVVTTPANTSFPSTFASEESESDSYQLRRLNWRQFESAMVLTWGRAIAAEAEKDGRQMKVVLPTGRYQSTRQPSEYSVVMRIDRVNNRLTFHCFGKSNENLDRYVN